MVMTDERPAPHRPYGALLGPRAHEKGKLRFRAMGFTPEQLDWLDRRAEIEGRSSADVNRALVEEAMRRERAKEARKQKKEAP